MAERPPDPVVLVLGKRAAAVLHLLGGIWIASCPTCGYQLTTARTQERCSSGPAADAALSADRDAQQQPESEAIGSRVPVSSGLEAVGAPVSRDLRLRLLAGRVPAGS